ncbi:MAG TPA: D-2-hydroxyacid dehydrogenase [Candidatus Acidoferrales bacterium]|nr:D-2-hydroxyacid dehydrogenase [Candidatus Acidoferrales bacterium]
MKVVTFFHLKEVRWALSDEDRLRLERRFPGVKVVSVDDPSELRAALADAEVFAGFHFPREHFAAALRLRWIHSASAGVEANLFSELLASEVILTNSTGLHAVSIPEHVLGQMLVLARNFHEALRLQERAEWNRFGVISFAGGVRELHGGNLAILGAGAIGRSLAPLAAALGMHVRVMRRDPTRPVPGAEAVVGAAALHALLAWADWVVCALPMTVETRGLIDAAALRALRSSAYLINIGRGESVDEAALVDALRTGAIAGAALDVFDQEPLPPEHPFWSLPNLVLTPHVSGYTPDYFQKMLAIFEDNLERFLSGRPLRNVVDKHLGYAQQE